MRGRAALTCQAPLDLSVTGILPTNVCGFRAALKQSLTHARAASVSPWLSYDVLSDDDHLNTGIEVGPRPVSGVCRQVHRTRQRQARPVAK